MTPAISEAIRPYSMAVAATYPDKNMAIIGLGTLDSSRGSPVLPNAENLRLLETNCVKLTQSFLEKSARCSTRSNAVRYPRADWRSG